MSALTQESDPTKINVELTYKVNLGNFQNMDIKIGVTDSPRPDETVPTAFNRIYGFVETKLIAKVTEVEESLKSE